MVEGVVREKQSEQLYTEAPMWMRTILNNAQAYADFIVDLVKSEQRVLTQAGDFLSEGNQEKALVMTGKREMLLELRHIVEAYRKEEVKNE
jgi:hypothetical protein